MNLKIIFRMVLCTGCALALSSNFNIEQSMSDESVVLGEIITNYLKKYFSKNQNFISIIFTPTDGNLHNFEEDYLLKLFNNPNLVEFSHNTFNKLDAAMHYRKNALSVIFVDDSESLSGILNKGTVRKYHLSQKYIIVVTHEKMESTENSLNDIFEILWENHLINSHVLIQDRNKCWSLLTFMPFQRDCYILTRLQIELFTPLNYTNNMTILAYDLFPRKLEDFKQCPVYVAATVDDPFVIRRNHFDKQYEGIDIDIINQISETRNFTIVYKRTPEGTGHGVIYPNKTVTGHLKLVWDGDADFTVGGYMLSEERTNIFAFTKSYLQSSVGICFKEYDAFSPFSRLAAPFQYYPWIAICGILLISVVVILLTKKLNEKWRHFYIGGRMNRTSILNMWSAVLGNPIANPQIVQGHNFGNFARTITILWIFLWLIVRSAYQGSLYTYLQGNRMLSPYDTFEKIRKSDFKITTPPSIFNMMADIFGKDRVIVGSTAFMGNLDIFYDQNILIVSSDLNQRVFNLKNSPRRRLAFTKDRLFMYSPIFYFRKTSVLVHIFDEQLQAIKEAGLVDFWIKKYTDDRKTQSKYRQPSKLQMKNIFAAFYICLTMYLIGFIVFVLEIITVRYRYIQTCLDLLTY